MPNDTSKPSAERSKSRSGLIMALVAVLLILIIIIILLLLKSCNADDGTDSTDSSSGAVVLEPDYNTISDDPNAEPIESEPDESAPEVSQGGGSVTISFKDQVTYSLSTGKISMFYQNPSVSTHNVVVQMILVHGEDEYLLGQSGVLKPGYQVTSMTVDKDAPRLSAGGYDGKIRLRFYDPETGERAIVDTDIPCTITVTD